MTVDPNLTKIEEAAAALGPLIDELVLVGGCAVGLHVTDPTSVPIRSTEDVDLVVETTVLGDYYRFCEKLRAAGFAEASRDVVICRWTRADLILDVMPAEEGVLGFANSWYRAAIESARDIRLPSGRAIKVVSAPVLLATKIESFHGRGGGDYVHHDIEDIVTILNGRSTIASEVLAAEDEVRNYVRSEFEAFLGDPDFIERLAWHLLPQNQTSRRELVIGRLRAIAGL